MMNKVIKLIDLWETLKIENSKGLVKKLYKASLPIPVYATYSRSNDSFGIAFSVAKNSKIPNKTLENLSELEVSILNDSSFLDLKMLHIQLKDNLFKDVFAILCEDLIHSVEAQNDKSAITRNITNQIQKWSDLFNKALKKTLSEEARIGLYGELLFLLSYLHHTKNDLYDFVSTWTGIEKTNKDFQGSGWAVEVKTSTLTNPQKAIINGERQLDSMLVDKLFLVHYSLEKSKTMGRTLPELVSDVYNVLSDDFQAICLFKTKLLQVGYRNEDVSIYTEQYNLRKLRIFKVENDFPRIIESDLRTGVSDVTYSISLPACDVFLVTETELFKAIL